MTLSAFPYTGGKTELVGFVREQFPEHVTYVEPFGGSAAVLLNKPRSNIEVYNDLDGDVVQFFEVARERPDELAKWVQRTPYSEELHAEWADEFYSGQRPNDPVERAGRFLYLRYTQFAGKYGSKSGFKRDTARTRVGDSSVWRGVPERIDEVCQRLQGVSIQNQHFRDIIEFYDEDGALFYCDPPYLGTEDSYRVNDFCHDDLAEALADIDGFALISYSDRPEGLYEGWNEVTRQHYHDSGCRKDEEEKQVTERLLLNYDPAEYPDFVDKNQTRITALADSGGRSLGPDTDDDLRTDDDAQSGGDA